MNTYIHIYCIQKRVLQLVIESEVQASTKYIPVTSLLLLAQQCDTSVSQRGLSTITKRVPHHQVYR